MYFTFWCETVTSKDVVSLETLERQLVVNSLSAYVATLRAFGLPLAPGVDLVANSATVACADGVMGP